MRRLLVVALLLGLAGSAAAANLGIIADPKPEGVIYDGGGRTGGDTIADATVIGALPYSDSGSTCGFVNDYDEVCPYTGSTSPDVVYSLTPTEAASLTIDLCASLYDTKVYVYEAPDYANPVACNDDAGCGYSGWQSKIENLSVDAGSTYYIVVDGYGGDCGEYIMDIAAYEPCVVDCPAGALIEGEPPCVDDYYDEYNGGCNSTGWTPVLAYYGEGCADLCGLSCTYLYFGFNYRDTDWFVMNAVGGNVDAACVAEFPLQFILIYGPNCSNLLYVLDTAGPCEVSSLSWFFAPGAELWLWVGASTFSGIPESDYVFTVCGIEGDVPTEETTWGSLKNNYR